MLKVAYFSVIMVTALVLVLMHEGLTIKLLLEEAASFDILLVGFLTILIHLPAMMTVAQQRKVLGALRFLKKYPEALVPLLILANWSLVGVVSGNLLKALVVGAAFCFAIGVAYAGVRLVVFGTNKSRKYSSHVPTFNIMPIIRKGNSIIYAIRVMLALMSLGLLACFFYGDLLSGWSAVIALLGAGASILVAYVTWHTIDQLSRQAGLAAKNILLDLMSTRPADVLLYVSGNTKTTLKSVRSLIFDLNSQGLKVAILAREKEIVANLGKTAAVHVWLAPLLASLDSFGSLPFKAVFYVNDAVKNGHFVRFNHLPHILMAMGGLSKEEELPRNLAMYDLVIAPDQSKATSWHRHAESELQNKVAYLKRKKAPTYWPATEALAKTRTFGLFLGPNPVTGELDPNVALALSSLLPYFKREDERELIVTTPKEKGRDPMSNALVQKLTRILERAEDLASDLILGSPVSAANLADIVIIANDHNLYELRQTGKPILWLGNDNVPNGLYSVDVSGEGFLELLSVIDKGISPKNSYIEENNELVREFEDLPTLVACFECDPTNQEISK